MTLTTTWGGAIGLVMLRGEEWDEGTCEESLGKTKGQGRDNEP